MSPYEALARDALVGVAPPESVGALLSVTAVAESTVDLAFASSLAGYVGWRWTASVAHIADTDPSVLEVELLPGDGSLLAPPWVPWADRLAEYRRTHPDEAPEDDADALDDDALDDTDDDDLDDDPEDEDAADDLDLEAVELDGVDFEDAIEPDDAEFDDVSADDGDADDGDADDADADDADADEGERTP